MPPWSEYGSAGRIPLASRDAPGDPPLAPRTRDRPALRAADPRGPRRRSWLYPLVYGIVLSLHDTQGFELTDFVGLDHYAHALLGDAVFHRSLLNTFLFTGAAVVLQTGLGLVLAVLVADTTRGTTFFQVVFFAPFVLAPVAVGAVWKFLYAPYFGVAATVGSALGFDTLTVAPLADADVALWAIMAAFLWRFAGFNMVVYLAAIRALPRDVLRARRPGRRQPVPAVPADHVAAALATDVRAGPADDPRDPAHLRHGLGHDRGRSLARHRDRRDRCLRRPRSASSRSAMRRRWR